MRSITFEGEIIHTKYWNVLGRNHYVGNYYNEYVEVGKYRTTTTKQCVNIPSKHIFEILTNKGLYRSEELPIFVRYKQEGNSFIPYNTKDETRRKSTCKSCQ